MKKFLVIAIIFIPLFIIACASIDGTYTGTYGDRDETNVSPRGKASGVAYGNWEMTIEEGKVSSLKISAGDKETLVPQVIESSEVSEGGVVSARTGGRLAIEGEIVGNKIFGNWGDKKSKFEGSKQF